MNKRRMNKRGFAGIGFMVGIITSVIVFIMMSALLPTMITMLGTAKGSNSANCVGYSDPTGQFSYNASMNSDTITCSILNFSVGMWVLSIVFAIIAGVITGQFAQGYNQQQYQQPQYQAY